MNIFPPKANSLLEQKQTPMKKIKLRATCPIVITIDRHRHHPGTKLSLRGSKLKRKRKDINVINEEGGGKATPFGHTLEMEGAQQREQRFCIGAAADHSVGVGPRLLPAPWRRGSD